MAVGVRAPAAGPKARRPARERGKKLPLGLLFPTERAEGGHDAFAPGWRARFAAAIHQNPDHVGCSWNFLPRDERVSRRLRSRRSGLW